MLKIGDVEINGKPLLLAPMEDVSDPAFRYMCKNQGADLMFTEFVSSDAVVRNIRQSFRKMTLFEEERPIAIQLYGRFIEAMVEAAKVAEEMNPEFIDINFGCPVKKIAMKGAGSGMLRDIPKMVEMTKAIVDAVKLPVTVKTRLGWDDDAKQQKQILDIAERLQDVGIQALTIHGRTRAQLYKGEADWTLIGELKSHPRINIPIIGNGDVDSPEKAKEMFDKYGVDAVMIGRASIGRPWIFREIKHYLETGELKPTSLEEKIVVAKELMRRSLEWRGMPKGIYEFRRHLSNMFKGLPHFKEFRLPLLTCEDPDEIESLLDKVAERYLNDHNYTSDSFDFADQPTCIDKK